MSITERECAYCETRRGLRVYGYVPGTHIPEDYICEDCFVGRDDGPCFDDLEDPDAPR